MWFSSSRLEPGLNCPNSSAVFQRAAGDVPEGLVDGIVVQIRQYFVGGNTLAQEEVTNSLGRAVDGSNVPVFKGQ
jgi:hypothetical protein